MYGYWATKDSVQEELAHACSLLVSAAPALELADVERVLLGEALPQADEAMLAVQALKVSLSW